VVAYDTKAVTPLILAEKVSGTGFGSKVHQVLTPEQFKQITGRAIGTKAGQNSGCCVVRAAAVDQTKIVKLTPINGISALTNINRNNRSK